MFGESDSESPRVPSPWDSLTSTPPTPPSHRETSTRGIPRLVPEAEEGNVEYKLQLLSPSPARFARLVTQLKWRLLEGGGQAYYELGVADSGALIGLPRRELEESLETLEMMAGEIGASVIVVKEVEVPPELCEQASSPVQWEGRARCRKDILRVMHEHSSPPASAPDVTDTEESDHSSDTSALFDEEVDLVSSLGTSPTSALFESTLAGLTIDTDLDTADQVEDKAMDRHTGETMALEIASVYKPRPIRKRLTHVASTGLSHVDKRVHHVKGKKGSHHPPHRTLHGSRHEVERDTLITNITTYLPSGNPASIPLGEDDAFDRELHVVVGPLDRQPSAPLSSALYNEGEQIQDFTGAEQGLRNQNIASNEPRLIVEALIVRKLSLDEAFLDFGAFSLC